MRVAENGLALHTPRVAQVPGPAVQQFFGPTPIGSSTPKFISESTETHGWGVLFVGQDEVANETVGGFFPNSPNQNLVHRMEGALSSITTSILPLIWGMPILHLLSGKGFFSEKKIKFLFPVGIARLLNSSHKM